MNYNFDEIGSGRGAYSVKWDTAKNKETIPMWIADMDFQTFPAITEALSKTAAKGFFGYNTVPDTFYDAIILWWEKRHHCTIKRDWILSSTGVISAISAAITSLIQPGDEVIIQPPTYNHFFKVLDGCNCRTVTNHLLYKDGAYHIDHEDLELKAASAKAKILLLCNPQNPVGRAWSEPELENIASICARHNIVVISDEIHSDLIFSGCKHVPFISVAEKHNTASITCGSASKTFNLSGLHAAYVFASDPEIRRKTEMQLWARASGTPSLMAIEALTVSYMQGEKWLDELKDYIYGNYLFLRAFIEEHLPRIKVIRLEATYVVWLDCKATGIKSAGLSDMLLEKEKLWVNAGTIYGTSGEGFIRLNIACPRKVLLEGLNRFKNLLVINPPHAGGGAPTFAAGQK